jgi:hypothetical protein
MNCTMKNSTAFLGLALVAFAMSCSKGIDKPGMDNNWIFKETTHVAKSVTAYNAARKIGATDGQATLRIQFFDKLPDETKSYKVVDYAPKAPDQISILATTANKLQYISRSNDTNVRVLVTVVGEDRMIKVDLPKVWVVATPSFADSVQVSATLTETMRLE